MIAHALEDAPDECCGMIGARDGVAEAVHRVENALHTPFAFEMEPRGQYQAWMAVEDADLEMVMYHSHTRSEPEPSQTDLNMAVERWPDPIWLIVGVRDPDAPTMRAWKLDGRAFTEVELEVS